MDRAIIHLNVADFAVAVERTLDRRLEGRPVIIAPAGAVRAAVYDMSEEAYRAGVRKGMPLPRPPAGAATPACCPPPRPLRAGHAGPARARPALLPAHRSRRFRRPPLHRRHRHRPPVRAAGGPGLAPAAADPRRPRSRPHLVAGAQQAGGQGGHASGQARGRVHRRRRRGAAVSGAPAPRPGAGHRARRPRAAAGVQLHAGRRSGGPAPRRAAGPLRPPRDVPLRGRARDRPLAGAAGGREPAPVRGGPASSAPTPTTPTRSSAPSTGWWSSSAPSCAGAGGRPGGSPSSWTTRTASAAPASWRPGPPPPTTSPCSKSPAGCSSWPGPGGCGSGTCGWSATGWCSRRPSWRCSRDDRRQTERRERLIGAVDAVRNRFGREALRVGRTVEPAPPPTRPAVGRSGSSPTDRPTGRPADLVSVFPRPTDTHDSAPRPLPLLPHVGHGIAPGALPRGAATGLRPPGPDRHRQPLRPVAFFDGRPGARG